MNTISRRRQKAIFTGSFINLIEWFDWYAYSSFAIYFSPSFFPDDHFGVQLLKSAGIFALGFLMRPVGGWLFGSMGDKIGRKKSMLISVWLMSFGSLLIACTPTYNTIGVLAPIILIVARMLQGLSVGGEVGISTAYLTEMATPRTRGFYASFQYVTLVGGQILTLGLLIVLQTIFLTDEQLHLWGWRIPFVIGTVLTLVTLYLRKDLHETRAYLSGQLQEGAVQTNKFKQMLRHPKAIMTVIGVTFGGTIAFYTFTTYMQKYLVNTKGISKTDSTWISFITLIVYAALHPVFGALSDRIGRKPLLIAFGLLGATCTIPLVNAIQGASSQLAITLLIVICLIIVSLYSSMGAVVKAEVFPAEVRAIGVGLPHAITVGVFGGSAEYVALWFKNIGHEEWFYWYVTAAIFISLTMFVFMTDTLKTNKINNEPDG